MAKSKQIGLRLDRDDEMALKRVSEREGRTEQDILRDSLHMYIRRAEEQIRFVESVERGWYELHSGLGEVVADNDDFFESVSKGIRNETTPS